ncbi:MAG: acyl carrier protein [Bacteroidales bacterium]|nr:acyl carrier protein [Bacteroidales bacterium]
MINTMFEQVKEILSRQLRIAPDRVTMDAQIKRDLGADSVDILQLLMRLEDDYGIVIPDQELAKFETVGDVVNFLDSIK